MSLPAISFSKETLYPSSASMSLSELLEKADHLKTCPASFLQEMLAVIQKEYAQDTHDTELMQNIWNGIWYILQADSSTMQQKNEAATLWIQAAASHCDIENGFFCDSLRLILLNTQAPVMPIIETIQRMKNPEDTSAIIFHTFAYLIKNRSSSTTEQTYHAFYEKLTSLLQASINSSSKASSIHKAAQEYISISSLPYQNQMNGRSLLNGLCTILSTTTLAIGTRDLAFEGARALLQNLEYDISLTACIVSMLQFSIEATPSLDMISLMALDQEHRDKLKQQIAEYWIRHTHESISANPSAHTQEMRTVLPLAIYYLSEDINTQAVEEPMLCAIINTCYASTCSLYESIYTLVQSNIDGQNSRAISDTIAPYLIQQAPDMLITTESQEKLAVCLFHIIKNTARTEIAEKALSVLQLFLKPELACSNATYLYIYQMLRISPINTYSIDMLLVLIKKANSPHAMKRPLIQCICEFASSLLSHEGIQDQQKARIISELQTLIAEKSYAYLTSELTHHVASYFLQNNLVLPEIWHNVAQASLSSELFQTLIWAVDVSTTYHKEKTLQQTTSLNNCADWLSLKQQGKILLSNASCMPLIQNMKHILSIQKMLQDLQEKGSDTNTYPNADDTQIQIKQQNLVSSSPTPSHTSTKA